MNQTDYDKDEAIEELLCEINCLESMVGVLMRENERLEAELEKRS